MATKTDENDQITLDIDALDAAAAGKTAPNGKSAPNGADHDTKVVVDPELAAKTGDSEVITPEAGLQKLKQDLENEKAARIAAENRAREAANAEAAARTEVQTSQLDQIKGAISQLTQATDVLEARYAEAAATGDWQAAAKAQRDMATNAARLAQLEAGKTSLERAPKPTPRAPVDPVEAYVSRIGAEFPRSRAWVRAHPEWAKDENAQEQILAAHQLAIRRGFAAESDGYFADIEQTLRITPAATNRRVDDAHVDDAGDATADTAARATGGRSTAPAAAPVTRSGSGAGGNRSNIVKLGPQQREMARHMFPDSKNPDLDYANNMTPEERARGPM
jgi:hypothetical protein